MALSSPKVSVILPVLNAAPYIRAAVESILKQSFTDFELIVIDDASTDGSREILRTFSDPRLRILCHEGNKKLIATLNEGLVEARG